MLVFAFINIVNSEAVAVCEPEANASDGVAIDDCFQFRKMPI
jgi:hypothetical protein